MYGLPTVAIRRGRVNRLGGCYTIGEAGQSADARACEKPAMPVASWVRDRTCARDGATVPLLGLSSWNNTKLVHSGGPYARSSIFVDVFLSTDSQGLAFTELYRS